MFKDATRSWSSAVERHTRYARCNFVMLCALSATAVQAAVCPVSTHFTSHSVGSIAFEHPDNWVAYALNTDHSYLRSRKGMIGWRIGPTTDTRGYLPACGLQITVQNLPDPGPRDGAWLIEHVLNSMSADLAISLTIKHEPRSLGEVRMQVHIIQGGLALSFWNIEEERFRKRIAVENARQRYLIDVNAPDPNDAAIGAVVARLLTSLTIRESVQANGTPTDLSNLTLQPLRPQIPVGTPACPADAIVGTWADSEVTGSLQAIDVSFTFNSDGSYSYFAGQGNAAWITHTGVFQISDMSDQKYRCKITLTPNTGTIRIASQAHLFAVQSRDLMDDKQRTFLYKFFPTPNRLMLAGTWTDWHNDIGTVGLDRK